MKKIVSIPLMIVILFTGITINMASHYCGGTYIASKISFSGELATCGMEHTHHEKSGINESDHLCQDFTSAFTFNSNYIPSTVQVVSDFQNFHVAVLSFLNLFSQKLQPTVLTAVNSPPGEYIADMVDLGVICVFRI